MCRRSSRPGCGCSPPVRAARPTPPTLTPSRWSASGWPGCVRSCADDQTWTVLRLLVDRRRSLGAEHTRKVAQLHALLLELLPGGAKKDLSAAQATSTAREGPTPRPGRQDPPPARGRAGRRPRAGLPPQEGGGQGAPRRCSPRPAPGCSTCTASDPQVPRGCWSRSATSPASPTATTSRPRPAPHPSTPPPATTSATGCRAAANRQINSVLHIMAIVQLRNDTEGRAYYDRKKADREDRERGHAVPQTPTLRHRLPHHARRPRPDAKGRAREGTEVATLNPARPAHNPNTGSSDKPLREPATQHSRTALPRGVLTQKGAMTVRLIGSSGDRNPPRTHPP